MDYIHLVKMAEKERFQALTQKDYKKFESLCDPELIYVHSSAKIDHLSSYMQKLESQYYIYKTIDYNIENIVEFSDNLLTFAIFEAELLLQGKPVKLKNRTLSIWKKTKDSVVLFAYQPTPIK
ncbi:nuclear transport factor 2 family protein [Acinetobacter guillouiae]|jgi:hypothetical protein|uniref:Nuclear transport factor 2 family protein n=1 Tax=Acinetobacter guillouiae TaxID=106649 RepID=A0A6A1RKR2_ACIGI|nr:MULTISPECIES: nuclear transport factor 2 family protein [Acinetobacter]MDN5647092.1 nuclear transport factor 2 family protein [Acinetobacter sp.]ENU57061.1 hypothetical protein F981_04196 [Acinetobacter guillouiae CIP 63.46]EPH33467.1 hypothetical protein L291_2893 [Acinetobacter guillouiae MSP4-18]KAB0623721.1 nuclear transport factor 2 family protein [Acinetobacter guillouiae]MCF0265670.1 nuclear transport factor 2 family protein [Acinetobacter guillouiae]